MRDFDSILQIIDSTITPDYLNSTQELVLREVWNGKTYAKIADDYNYDSEYIKTVGCNLWQILSDAFNEQINKSNFVPFMRRQASFIIGDGVRSQDPTDTSNLNESRKQQKYYWNTAPEKELFWGRDKELKLLKSWNQDSQCNCIVISGLVGAGKTSLAIKFSRDIQDIWDYVIWYSLDNPPPVTKLITYYLKLINPDFVETITESLDNLSLLISQFIQDLKKNKVLLVLDGLENLLTIDRKKSSIFYKKEFEGYNQLIRSIISANHQSLLVCTTQVIPRSFRYYQPEQMKLLEIGGLCDFSVKKHIDENTFTLVASSKLLQIYNCVGNNPRLMNIVKKNLYMCEEQEDLNLLLNELSSLEETIALLEKEIEYLSNSQKEIIYWLSTSSSSVCLKELLIYSELSKTKLKFMQDLDLLQKKNLIAKQDSLLSLMPIMKNYLRRKLIYQSFNRTKS